MYFIQEIYVKQQQKMYLQTFNTHNFNFFFFKSVLLIKFN